MRKIFLGFTLAEVLITLGIIGVVAAITLPTIIQNYKRLVYSARMKKFCTTFNQAIIRSEVDNGPAIYWYKGNSVTSNGNYDYDANADISKDYMERFIFPYMQNVTKFKYNSLFAFRMNDGAEFRIWNGNCLDIRYDINGLDNPPNQQGRDIFIFLLCLNDAERIARFQDKNKVFGGYIGTNMSRTQALNMCKSNSITCSSLIEIDGCEFKKDFPYKF